MRKYPEGIHVRVVRIFVCKAVGDPKRLDGN